MTTLRIGSRGSKLAVSQAEWVGARLKEKNPNIDISFSQIKTTGDRDANSSLTKIGGKGVFVKEIEDALLEKKIDLAVHSLKDVPQALPDTLILGPTPQREDPRDAFISRFGELLRELPRASTVGTGSPRRVAQIRHQFKQRYKVEGIRGNVETRLSKLQNGDFDGIVLAAAGLKRLGLEGEITEILEPDQMLPAPCQGCLGLEIREKDQNVHNLVQSISDLTSDLQARTERSFLQGLGGSCLLPVAGLSNVEGDEISISAMVFDPSGEKKPVRAKHKGPKTEPELVGGQLAELLLREGASEILLKIE